MQKQTMLIRHYFGNIHIAMYGKEIIFLVYEFSG